jgi:hypothetical protein
MYAARIIETYDSLKDHCSDCVDLDLISESGSVGREVGNRNCVERSRSSLLTPRTGRAFDYCLLKLPSRTLFSDIQ